LKTAIDDAYDNIRKFHELQKSPEIRCETKPGVVCWQKAVPIQQVGLYIPGGTAPLFSTVLMLGIPAQIAGCSSIVLCTPPGKDSLVHPAVLYAASKCGIKNIVKAGGAQAIAGMTFGTETIQKVDKIFGPGNAYVTCAKMMAMEYGIAIDMPAGPSELAVIADETCVPEFVAADLLSQAEHGNDSQVILVSNQEQVIKDVMIELEKQLADLPRKDIANRALEKSLMILVNDLDEGMELLNAYAPEHLIICCKENEKLVTQVANAGSVFIGNYSPESAGDYASGTNHTLPTNGHARAYSGLSLDSFCKKITFQEITKKGLTNIGPGIEIMAKAEGLDAHARAVEIRLKNINS
jgi:histidinol dehydrogenase